MTFRPGCPERGWRRCDGDLSNTEIKAKLRRTRRPSPWADHVRTDRARGRSAHRLPGQDPSGIGAWRGCEMAVVAALAEELLGVGLPKVAAADLGAGDVAPCPPGLGHGPGEDGPDSGWGGIVMNITVD